MRSPDLTGYELDKAVALLEAAGWQVGTVRKTLAPGLENPTGPWRVAKVERSSPNIVCLTVVEQIVLGEAAEGS